MNLYDTIYVGGLKVRKKKSLWIVLLVIGIITFVIPLASGLYYSIMGYSGICILECKYYYGFRAFRDAIILYSWIFWPTYIIGFILILLSIIKLKKCK